MQTFCPKCGTKLGADESLIGKTVQCGKCSNRFTVQPLPEPAPLSPSAPEDAAATPPPAPLPLGGPLPPIGSSASPATGGEAEVSTDGVSEEAAGKPADPGLKPSSEPVAPPTGKREKPSIKKTIEDGAKCPKCGAALQPNAVLCTGCGEFLQPGMKPATDAKKPAPWLKIAAVSVGVVVVGLAAWFYFHKEPPPPPTTATAKPGGAKAGVPTQSPGPAKPVAKQAASAGAAKPIIIELPPITPEEREAVSKLPAQDPNPPALTESNTASKPSPLVLCQPLLKSVGLKGPSKDRWQTEKTPRISPKTRLVTFQFVCKQDEMDQTLPLNPETVHVETDAGPGVLYGVEFSDFLFITPWRPRGATADSSSILESAQLTTRRVSDFTTDMLTAGRLIVRAEFTKWFGAIAPASTREGLLAVSAQNQFIKEGTTKLETESGSFFCPSARLSLHVLIPATAHSVRVRLNDTRPLLFPIEALAGIPTASQPEPLPFINETVDKARALLDAGTTEEAIAGAQLLTEAGNLDMQDKLKPTAFTAWANSVTQLLAHATADCRAAAVDTIFRSRHVDTKLRVQLLSTAIQDQSPIVRQRAAELISEKPTLFDQAFKESMQSLQNLIADSNAAVRSAAQVSNCRLAVLGDDNTFESQREFIEKGLRDPAPSVRAALIKSMAPLQFEDEKVSMSRLGRLMKVVRLHLFDSSEAVRSQTARTILAIRSPVCTAVASDVLQQAPGETADTLAHACLELVAANTAELIQRSPALADPKAQAVLAPKLVKLLDDATPRVRQSAARLLGIFPVGVATDALAVAVTNSDPGVRIVLWSSLDGPLPASILVRGLNDTDERIRRVAFGMIDPILADKGAVAGLVSNVVANVPSPGMRLAVAQRIAAPAVNNAPMLLAMSPFLADKDDGVWRAAVTPWAKTTLRFPWKDIAPVWDLLIQQPTTARRQAGFYVLRVAAPETPKIGTPAGPAPEALEEAAKLLSDPDPHMREPALLFMAPCRTAAQGEAIRKILTDSKAEFSAAGRNQLLVALARPSPSEEFMIVDKIRPTTEEDRKKEREALAAAAASVPKSAPGVKSAPAIKAQFQPINNRVLVPTASDSGIYLLAQWAVSENPSANAAAGYLLQLVQGASSRSWLLPSERARFVQSLRKLSEVPSVSANAKPALDQFEARFPRGLAAKALSAEQTKGVTDSLDSLVDFMTPKERPMTIATYKSPAGALIDIWYSLDETPPPAYPPGGDPGAVWKFVSKLEGSRIENLDKETLARLEWAAANAPKEKLREALLKIAKAEGELALLSRRVALEGLVLLADQGDTEAETQAIKLGWVKM